MKNIINGAVFDADGTLLDSMHIWHELGARFLRSINVTPEEGLAEILYNMTLEQGSYYLQQRYKLNLSCSEILHGILSIIEDFYVHEVKIKPGVKNFLERTKLPAVIATSGDKELLTAALIRNGIDNYFSDIFTCSELDTNKHEPKIFLECSRSLGLNPQNIMVFEDALFALRTAHDSGFITAGVYDDSNKIYTQEIMELANYYIQDWRNFSL